MNIWVNLVGEKTILFEYYEKPMKTNLVLQAQSAISENTKVGSLSQEVVRVLKNCSEDINNEARLEHLENFCVKMKTSGYNNQYTRKILFNGIKCYEGKLTNSKLDKKHPRYKPLHLSKSFNAAGRMEKKLLAKADWFKQRKKEDNPEIVNDEMKDRRKKKFRKAGNEGEVACRLENDNEVLT